MSVCLHKTRVVQRPSALTEEHQVLGSRPPAPLTTSRTRFGVLLGLSLLLREHTDAEVSVEMRFEGGRDDQVLSRRQLEARADLTQVDEGFGSCRLSVGQEVVLVQMHLPLALILKGGNSQSGQPVF